jgi:uncharacterized protein with HEPN domain
VGQRNVLAHEYGDVDPAMMWGLARRHIPVLIQQLEQLHLPTAGDEVIDEPRMPPE